MGWGSFWHHSSVGRRQERNRAGRDTIFARSPSVSTSAVLETTVQPATPWSRRAGFLSGRSRMGRQVKQPTTLEEQLELLSKRGMTVDETLARQWLSQVSYHPTAVSHNTREYPANHNENCSHPTVTTGYPIPDSTAPPNANISHPTCRGEQAATTTTHPPTTCPISGHPVVLDSQAPQPCYTNTNYPSKDVSTPPYLHRSQGPSHLQNPPLDPVSSHIRYNQAATQSPAPST